MGQEKPWTTRLVFLSIVLLVITGLVGTAFFLFGAFAGGNEVFSTSSNVKRAGAKWTGIGTAIALSGPLIIYFVRRSWPWLVYAGALLLIGGLETVGLLLQ